ncbi:acyl-coenzyme A thioesterase 1-like [Protopterus annectens]|uniref:acyl-coenzyme A thioesterase 1-like n=1 Tax=Protopterus annectens TaxID=7888 RepID=UPI001CFAE09A|nr:acyl-coenzyme A thioesterase 1-like [Protopterus annectens]
MLRSIFSRSLVLGPRLYTRLTVSRHESFAAPPNLRVTPPKSLADEMVRIRASGLEPREEVTVQALLVDEAGRFFSSCAQYRADIQGIIDLATDPSRGGHYTGIEPMGLFWSLHPAKMEIPYQRLQKKEVTKNPFIVELTLHHGYTDGDRLPGRVLARARAERWFVAPGVRRIRLREGRVRGSLFLPPGDGPFPGVIDLFGDGGLLEYRASLLASRGFASLALPYFGFEDLPQIMTDFHLEYFEEAAIFLQHHPKVKGPGIGVLGTAKGADLALSMVTFLPQVVAAVSISGCIANTTADLHYKDMTIPGMRHNMDRVIISETGIFDVSETLGNPSDWDSEESIIPIEEAEGHFLFVVGEGDRYWKSDLFAEAAVKRLTKYGKSNFEYLSYPGAGHRIDPPWSPFCFVALDQTLGVPLLEGGEARAHAHAQVDVWAKIQDFLRFHLK